MNVTASSKRLGQLLAELRVQAGLTVRTVAAELGCSPAKVTRQEKGTHVVSRPELAFLVKDLYGGDAESVRPLEWLRQKSEDGNGWWHETGDYIVEHFRTYLSLEADAHLIQTISHEVIPGLLQTENYIRTQAEMATDLSQDVKDRYLAVRLCRQQRLTDLDDPLRLEVVISESALLRSMAHPGSDQVAGLIKRAQLPTVDLRILPLSTGQPRTSGSFSIIHLPEGILPPVVYQSYAIGGELIENPDAVSKVAVIYNDVRASALDQESSLEFLRKLGET